MGGRVHSGWEAGLRGLWGMFGPASAVAMFSFGSRSQTARRTGEGFGRPVVVGRLTSRGAWEDEKGGNGECGSKLIGVL